MGKETTRGPQHDPPPRLWYDPTGPILAETSAGAGVIARVEARADVIRLDGLATGAGIRLVVGSEPHLLELCAEAHVPVVALTGDLAADADRLRWALDIPGGSPHDDATDDARSWLLAVREEEARSYTERTTAEAAAEDQRVRHLDAMAGRIEHLERHITAIEESRSWRVATALQRVAAQVRRDPPTAIPDTDTAPHAAHMPGSAAAALPSALPLRARIDLCVADLADADRPGGHHDLAVWHCPGGPQALGDAPIIAVLDPGAMLLQHGLDEAGRTLDAGNWDAVLTSERAHAGQPSLEPRAEWSLLTARSWTAASGLVALRRSFVEHHGGFREEAGWVGAHDLLLRAGADARVTTVAAAGCSRAAPIGPRRPRRSTPGVLHADLLRRQADGFLETAPGLPGAFRHRSALIVRPVVSVIVPTRDRPELLSMVLAGLEATLWRPLEIIVVDNGSADPRTLAILDRTPHRVERAPIPFNFPRLVNRGAAAASGDILVFLNNDVELRDPDWVGALVELSMDRDIGPVGTLLRYPDGTIQHCGMAIGPDGPVHPLRGVGPDHAPAGLALVPGERTAVTAACMAIRSEIFWRLGGFEPLLAHDYNDVDLCLRARRAGYRVGYTPFTDLIHHESASRGTTVNPETVGDWLLMRSRWAHELKQPDRWWPSGIAMTNGLPQPA